LSLVLVDSSIWIDHIRRPEPGLSQLLAHDRVLQHRLVTAELALGSLPRREPFLTMLDCLLQVEPARHEALLAYVSTRALFGTGVGVIDAHLLIGAEHHAARIWTRDRRLAQQAERLGVLYRA
jgi:predicted nucleic acid-binding protein